MKMSMEWDFDYFARKHNQPKPAAKTSAQRMRELRARNPDYDRQYRERRDTRWAAWRAAEAAPQTTPQSLPAPPAPLALPAPEATFTITLSPFRELELIPVAANNPPAPPPPPLFRHLDAES